MWYKIFQQSAGIFETIGKGFLRKMTIVSVHRVCSFAPVTILQKPGTNDRAAFFSDPRAIEAAREKWIRDRQGEFSHFYSYV